MRSFFFILFLFALSLFTAGQGQAQISASHTVSISIDHFSVLSVSGDPAPMILDAQGGSGTTTLTDATTSYNLTTNVENVVITAELNSSLPAGLELWLSGETGLGTSAGLSRLDATQKEVQIISGIGRGLENGRSLTYRLVVSPNAGIIPLQSRQVRVSLVEPDSGRRHEVVQTIQFGVTTSFGSEATN